MKVQLREQAIKLRLEQKLGYASIAKILPVARSTLSSWLKNYPLSEERIQELRRQNLKNNEAKIEKYIYSMREKRELKFKECYDEYRSKFLHVSKESEFIAGLMLYLAEGNKKDDYRIVLANTDSKVIKFHIKWASEFFDIPKRAFKIQLHLYPNMDINREVRFWKNELRIKDNQFYKHQIRTLKPASFSYRESFRHGTCSVYFSSSEKKRKLTAAISAFVDSFLGNIAGA